MEKELFIGIAGLIGLFLLYKFMTTTPPAKVQEDHYTDILNKEEYKVKGQWEK